ncbi:Rha family transcriptional regulator [Escherichia coli]|jgi:Rha family phage regulatory protein|uniref:Rha family phage regulatory protein n=1 Tax=Escherichia coli TaxID=562 RepID=UPI0005306F1B|nr:Rha family phage regulatory protein [Escherichia coli]UTA43201.1 Rha family transcriptional regulator [Klebsiella quasipneumoniae]EEW2009201.1 peptidase [Escherichia coli]EFO0016395.1 peptidase [Escherichia coli]EFO3893039.1 peptidase [Escherichia coli]EGD6079194.1 peptidase [Escherichia coli]
MSKPVMIDSDNSGRYIVLAAAKSVAGIGVPEFSTAHNRAKAVFLCAMQGYIQIMVGRAGASKDAPVSVEAGYANPVRFTTSQIGVCGGDCPNHSTGAVVMTTIPTLAQPEITVINGLAVTSSLAIADYFAKRHDDVLKKIRTLECSPEFRARNFAETSISVNQPNGGTRKLPCYQITRDGFAFLAMGFTGKRAARFKEAYITAFNQMEQALIGKVDTSCVAHNAHVVYLYMAEIHRVWLEQLYPMLVSVQSPLASSLYDYINDGVFVAGLVDSELNEKHKEVRK